MKPTLFRLIPMTLVAMSALPLSAAAQDTGAFAPIELAQSKAPGQGGTQGRRPPPEAFEACETKAAGADCDVALRDGTALQGTCHQPPQGRDTAMVCVPAGTAPRG